jgi:hypothetical protein
MRLPNTAHTSHPWRIHEREGAWADRATEAGSVRQIAVPAAARALSTLPRVDYADAFVLDTGPDANRTAEQWARTILEDAPLSVRGRLLSGWSAIGLKLARDRSDSSVLGWPIRDRSPDFVLLGADSHIGMPGELLFERERRTLLFATFVQQENRMARAVWAGVEPVHVPTVRQILEHAGRRRRP